MDVSLVSADAGSKPSGRKGSRKVRTGCITCKVRKVKCDETKPFCLRCVKSGRKCDGYISRSASARSSPDSVSDSAGPAYGPGLVEIPSPAGKRAFDYYRSRTVPLLGGSIDAGFWGGLVLKLSATEPAVQHAMLAMSSFHESINLDRVDYDYQIERAFAFSEYGKAIGALRCWNSQDGHMAIPLLVCVLFTCIEFLLDQDTTAQLHICQGRQILSRLENSRSPKLDMIRRDLVPIYTRLSLASFLFGSKPPPIPGHLRRGVVVPSEFASLREARTTLHHLLDEGLRFSTAGKSAVYAAAGDEDKMAVLREKQQRLLSQLGQWDSAFTILTTRLHPNQADPTAQTLLQIYRLAASIWISTALQLAELCYDAQVPAFASIIALSSSIINSCGPSLKAHAFTFETELIAPLYWTATKCRHPLLRRAALRLLMRDEMRDRRENLWYASESIVIAARVIEIEEGEDGMLQSLKVSGDGFSPASYSSTTIPGTGASTGSRSDFESLSSIAGSIHVPTSQPPTLPAPRISLTPASPQDDTSDILSTTELCGRASSHFSASHPPSSAGRQTVSLADMSESHANVDPPYGVPEAKRIKNTLIGARQGDGIWVTMFKDPGAGEKQWDVTRELLIL